MVSSFDATLNIIQHYCMCWTLELYKKEVSKTKTTVVEVLGFDSKIQSSCVQVPQNVCTQTDIG